jgi:hypothetical protein
VACLGGLVLLLHFIVNRHISGRADMYVDDLLGVSLTCDAPADIEVSSDICRKLFNSDCIEDSKTEMGSSVIALTSTPFMSLFLKEITTELYTVYALSTPRIKLLLNFYNVSRHGCRDTLKSFKF